MLKDKLKAYIDANVPIIYVNSYDDNAVEESILKASGRRKDGNGIKCMDF